MSGLDEKAFTQARAAYAQGMNVPHEKCLEASIRACLAAATPADVGELVGRLRARLEHTFDYATQGAEWQKDALCQEAATALERVVRERDNLQARLTARAKSMLRLREALAGVHDNIEDEGDRTYFGGTNDADTFREVWQDLDAWAWDDIMSDGKMTDVCAASREAHTRATSAEAKLAEALADRAAQAERMARLERKLRACQWYWPEDDTSSETCADSAQEVVQNAYDYETPEGGIVAIARGGVVEVTYCAYLPPADDSDSDDDFWVEEETREAAKAKIDAELARRALSQEGSDA